MRAPASQDLSPAEVPEDLAQRGARGGASLIAASGAQFVIAVVSAVILARLLTPEQFGVFALAMIAFGVLLPVHDLGLGAAIVQWPTFTRTDLRRLRAVNAVVTLGACVAGWALGELLIDFYQAPAMRAPLLWLIAGLGLRCANNVTKGRLQRARVFGHFAWINVAGAGIAAVLGCVLAWRGYGVLALAVQQFTIFTLESVFLQLVARRVLCDGRGIDVGASPRATLGWLRAGFTISGSLLLTESTQQADRVVLGRVADTFTLGLYQNALRWASVPLQMLLEPLRMLTVATLARLVTDPPRYRAAVRDLFETIVSVILPAFVALSLCADPVIRLLLGDQWLLAIPLLAVLALAFAFTGVESVADWLHLADGRVGARLRWLCVRTPLLIVALMIGGRWGAHGVALAVLLANALLLLPGYAVALRGTAVGAGDLLRSAARPVCATAIASAALLSVQASRPFSATDPVSLLLRLAVLGGVFGTVYAAAWWSLPGGRQRWRRMWTLLRQP